MSHDGEDYTQIAFLRSDIDDSTGEYTERFEAGSFDMPAADALRFDLAVDLMDYFSGRTFEGEPGVSRGLEPREAVAAVEGATGCDLNFFEDFWLGSPGEIVESVHVGPYTKQSLLDFSYYAKELSRRYGFADSDILEIARHLPEECPDRFAAVKAYLDCEYVPDGDAPDEKTYRWGDFLEIAGGDARYAAMLVDRTAAGESEEGLHPETLVDQDIRDGEAFMLAGRPIAPEDAYDLPGTVHGLYKELADNVDRSGMLFRDWRGFAAGTDADDVLRAIEAAFGETEYSRAFGIAAGAVRTSASTGVERNGLHFYYGDEPKPGPEFFRERHSKTRPIVCLETGETFDGNPAAARPLHVSPATISQAGRYGTPVAGLHFYHGDEPKPAPEFFKPIKPERGKSPMQMAAAARAAAGNPGRPDGGQRPRRAV